ncbi:hypothetical protein [Blackfly microvirus SF02]|uniref:Uncharacterized protein n=1 Tax=Blackfly microvirus SF02 TaxID=2576452 RepID=A0A4P8PKJ8_9VIRU|nr:hypothetical protein [Blackfly microvirus SF02]
MAEATDGTLGKRPKLRTQYNYKVDRSFYETGGGTSLTVPDETLSIKEILNKYVKGQNMSDMLSRQTGFNSEESNFDDPDLDALKRLDEIDRKEYAKSVQNDIANFESDLKRQQESIAEKQKDDQKKSSENLKKHSSTTDEDDGPGTPDPGHSPKSEKGGKPGTK